MNMNCLVTCPCILLWQEAHISGVAQVVACAQDQAEGYCEGLRLNGLVASLEPGR